MFDIGFWELAIIGVVALIVLGPERLPGAARTAGLWLRKARQTLSSIQGEIERELNQQELKKVLDQETLENLEEFKQEVKAATQIQEIESIQEEVRDEIAETRAALNNDAEELETLKKN